MQKEDNGLLVWPEGNIGDSDFVSGIEYMLKEKIIQIDKIPMNVSIETNEIPNWVRSNADWWSQGLISDNDFTKGIAYLIEKGIIRV